MINGFVCAVSLCDRTGGSHTNSCPALRCERRLRIYVDPRIRIILGIAEDQRDSVGLSLVSTKNLMGLSQARFRRLFRQEVGKTFQQYLRETRMARGEIKAPISIS